METLQQVRPCVRALPGALQWRPPPLLAAAASCCTVVGGCTWAWRDRAAACGRGLPVAPRRSCTAQRVVGACTELPARLRALLAATLAGSTLHSRVSGAAPWPLKPSPGSCRLTMEASAGRPRHLLPRRRAPLRPLFAAAAAAASACRPPAHLPACSPAAAGSNVGAQQQP